MPSKTISDYNPRLTSLFLKWVNEIFRDQGSIINGILFLDQWAELTLSLQHVIILMLLYGSAIGYLGQAPWCEFVLNVM